MRTRSARWDVPLGVMGMDLAAAAVLADAARPHGYRYMLTPSRLAALLASPRRGRAREGAAARNRQMAQQRAEANPAECRVCGVVIPYRGGSLKAYRGQRACSPTCASALTPTPPRACRVCRCGTHRGACPLGRLQRPATLEAAPARCDRCGGPWRSEALEPGYPWRALACVTCGRRCYAQDELRRALVG